MLPIGTIVNVAAVLLGGCLGLLLRGRTPDSFKVTLFHGLALCVMVLGMKMAFTAPDVLQLIFAVALGGAAGEALKLEDRLERVSGRMKKVARSDNPHFVDGMVTAFLVFCVGPMTIVGAFDEGIRNDPTLLLTKSVLDGFGALAFAATYGVGVLFSVLPLALYQGALTLGGSALQSVFTPPLIDQITATGGVLILGIGVKMLDMQNVRVGNLLPALVFAPVIAALFAS